MTAVTVPRPRPAVVLVSLVGTWVLSILLLPAVLLTWLVYGVASLPVGVREFVALVVCVLAFWVLFAVLAGGA